MASSDSAFIKEEPHSTTSSALPGNRKTALPGELTQGDCSGSHGNTEGLISGDHSEAAVAENDSVCIKTEPYNTSSSALSRSHRNKDEAKTDQHPESSAMASSVPVKKRRASAWSDDERLEFLQEIMQRKNVVRGRFGPLLTKLDKKAAWEEIAAVLNARHPTVLRTVPELKKQWDNLCSRHRAIFSEFRRLSLQTGAGVTITQPSPVTQAVMDIISDDPPIILGVERSMDAHSAAAKKAVIAGLPEPFNTDDPDDEDSVFQATIPVVGLYEDNNFVVTCQAEAGDGTSPQPLTDNANGTREHQVKHSTQGHSQLGRSDTYSLLVHTRAETAKLEKELLAVRQTVLLEEIETHRLKQQTELMKQETERLLQARIQLEMDHLQQQK